jgi:hypothetical protein
MELNPRKKKLQYSSHNKGFSSSKVSNSLKRIKQVISTMINKSMADIPTHSSFVTNMYITSTVD